MIDIKYGEKQFYDIKQYCLTEGKANGVQCIDLDLGDLCYTLISDRCLDIGSVKYRGKQYAFLSSNGIVSPFYYNPDGYGWLESFAGGLLVTCGLENAGEPNEFNGIKHGLHGRISSIPAQNVYIKRINQSGEVHITISGTVNETRLLGLNYMLHRTVKSVVGGNYIEVSDSITNCSDFAQPLMLLYHLNFGYPIISPESILKIPGSGKIEPFDEIAQKGLEHWDKFLPPDSGVQEEVFLHKIKKSAPGEFSITNPVYNPEIGLNVQFSNDSLPYLALWKSQRIGEYAAALEPCNNHVRGLAWEHENGDLRMLNPGETENTSIVFTFFG